MGNRGGHIHEVFAQTEAETRMVIETFEELSELPNIVGGIDGSHVRIKAPKDSAVDYFSRYQQHYFIIEAVVNGRKLFLDFAYGCPGSMHDARVLQTSAVFRTAEQGHILSAPTININGHEICPYFVGDSAYLSASGWWNDTPKVLEIVMKLGLIENCLLQEWKSSVHSAYLRVGGGFCKNVLIALLALQSKTQ